MSAYSNRPILSRRLAICWRALNAAVVVACVMLFVPMMVHAQAIDPDATIDVEINKGRLFKLPQAASAVVIANPDIADVQVVSPGLVYINGKSVGETTVFAVDSQDNQVLNAVVTVTHNLSKLKKTVSNILPDADVNFSSTDGALVMGGNVDSPLQAENIRKIASPFLQENQTLVNMIKIGGSDQVMLQVKVAEVSRTELKRFGINFESLLSTGNFIFGLAQGRDFIDGAAGTILRAGQDNSFSTQFRTNRANINGIIDALEDDGLVTTLAEPNLTTTSGQPASFLAGGEFPVPSVDDDGEVSVEYRPFGVSLSFTPTVLDSGKISLVVNPEVSALSQVGAIIANGFSIPSLSTRRASATVELGSGQSFAIAGLIQNDSSNDISKFPGLGDIPILGALFRSSEFQHDQSELVIIVTPYLVTPSSEKLATPVDGYVPASDMERILLGKLYHEQTPEATEAVAANMPHLQGPVGFILK